MSEDKMRRGLHAPPGGLAPGPGSLTVQGRRLDVPRQAGPVAWFDFEELCARPLGAADYLALATHYPVILIDRVPRLSATTGTRRGAS